MKLCFFCDFWKYVYFFFLVFTSTLYSGWLQTTSFYGQPASTTCWSPSHPCPTAEKNVTIFGDVTKMKSLYQLYSSVAAVLRRNEGPAHEETMENREKTATCPSTSYRNGREKQLWCFSCQSGGCSTRTFLRFSYAKSKTILWKQKCIFTHSVWINGI